MELENGASRRRFSLALGALALPGFRLKDKDRARYAASGESDRFTLRFVKR